ncbi:PAS domain-containing hybrid sensor histidine kinase/response regulator [Massilia forsythiae]|uniref:PAS domain-containing hybrid sensor histidine kinase/response regulator n=1 Tax=Massilia forsythiae TaxID=2728020 RepID=UPI0021039A12|nr:ATP-binding protein [Massilia forsythiae]
MLLDKIFHSAFDSSPIGQYLLAPTEGLEILAVNQAFLTSVSRTRAELQGHRLFEAFPNDPDDATGTGIQNLRRSIAAAIATGHSQSMEAQRYPIRMQADGRSWFEDRYWSATNTPIYDDDGALLCISHTTIDITARVRSEVLLRESESRLSAYVSATSDVLYRMSPNWTHMHELDGRGFLKTTRGWAEYRIEQYVHPDDLELARRHIRDAIDGKRQFELEHRVLRADGSPGWTYSRAVPLLDAQGDIREWIGSASDITERKLAELKLRDIDQRKDEFLAMLAHELRNPLAPISAAAELLLLADFDQERVRRTSEIIVRQVRHMTSLVDDLLEVSRVTRGLVELDNTALDLAQVVADAVEQAGPLIAARRQHLSIDLVPGALALSGDKKRLVQVFANLVHNAAKYTPEHGSIRIRAAMRDSDILVEVADDGVGMDAQLVDRVFDLFAQASVTSDRSSGGLGLGLSLVKNIVELHGGRVHCESPGPGLGSTFTVCLPCLERQSAAMPDLAPRPSVDIAGPLRVLVVDDNVDAADVLGMLLEAAGHAVTVAHDPLHALELARAERPDVCLLDIGLPRMDGNELARRLRTDPATASALLVAVTGYGQAENRQRSHASGFDHHLVKPLDYATLEAILDGIHAGPRPAGSVA